MSESLPNSIAVIGGGLAGLAAAEAASRFGIHVKIFEQAAQLGGRAGSFVEPFNNRLIDFCQHAAMGCCTNFLDFCRRTSVADCFRHESNMHFIGPDNQLRNFAPSKWLPAPFHLLTGLKKLDYLTSSERSEIARALKQLARNTQTNHGEAEITFGDWLASQKQSENAVKHFWSVIIHGALSETVVNVSFSAVRKVFVDGFLSARSASEMILPNSPLTEIFDDRVGRELTDRGINIHRRSRVMWIETDEDPQLSLVFGDGDAIPFDAVILAVPWHQSTCLFPPLLLEGLPEILNAQKLLPSSIIAVHLWFDRPIIPLPHAILVGKLSQWFFQGATRCPIDSSSPPPSRTERHFREFPASQDAQDDSAFSDYAYYQVIISAAHRLAVMEKDTLLDRVLEDLAEAFPDSKSAQLVHSRVIIQPQAAFSMLPGIEKLRPSQTTSVPNLFLAGDWTTTGWPATMEGAVRSGYLAVESMLTSSGRHQKILVPDLPRGFFAKRIIS